MKKINVLSVLLLMAIVFFIGCDKDDNKDSNNTGSFQYPTVTVTHAGFDFSAGKCDTANWNNNDGEVISWNPDQGQTPNYPSYTSFVWWRNNHIGPDYKNKTKDMGVVSLASVTQVPSSWDTTSNILPLIPGHTIVAQCNDGYVKFEVISADTSNMWNAKIKYYYSTSTTFDK